MLVGRSVQYSAKKKKNQIKKKSYLYKTFPLPVNVPNTLPSSLADTELQSLSAMSIATFLATKKKSYFLFYIYTTLKP